MTDNKSPMMALLNNLRQTLTSKTESATSADSLALWQAFDRLYLGYQNGTYSEDQVNHGIEEIQHNLEELTSTVSPLMPSGLSSTRTEVLKRNYQQLAERMLDQERGSWDSRHLEIVQGAITELSRFETGAAKQVASDLQKRMSESLWINGIEFSETVAEFENESESLKKELFDLCQREYSQPKTMSVSETDLTLAKDTEMVNKAIRRVQPMSISAAPQTKVQSSPASAQLSAGSGDLQVLDSVSEGLKEAIHKMVNTEYSKLLNTYKAVMVSASKSLAPAELQKLSDILHEGFESSSVESAALLHDHTRALVQNLSAIQNKTPEIQNAIKDLERAQLRASILDEIGHQNDEAQQQSKEATAQYLDARMLYEQKRMQFERTDHSDTASQDLLKALDYQVSKPGNQIENARQLMMDQIRLVREVAQSSASGDIGLYAPAAGAEHNINAANALKAANHATPMVTPIPTIHSLIAKSSNKMLHDASQLAYHPSVRNEMGFIGNRYEMSNSAQPLFKRIRFQKDNPEANRLLPALYHISGVKLKEDPSKPLRKAFSGLNLTASNLELVKMIEEQYNDKVTTRQTDTLIGTVSNTLPHPNNVKEEAMSNLSYKLGEHRARNLYGTDASILAKAGHQTGDIEASLRTEGRLLPTSVQQELSPFFDFDLSNIRIYAGPIAAAAAEAMGAHAFTLGRNIFIGENKLDYSSAIGKALIAHEIKHTTHFESNASVDAKEQEAEAVEAKVLSTMGERPALALEKQTTSGTPLLDDTTAQMQTQNNFADEPLPFDIDDIYDSVCEIVLEKMTESIEIEKLRQC